MGDAYHEFGALQETPSSLGNDDIDRNLKFIEDLQNLGVSRYIDMPQVTHFSTQFSESRINARSSLLLVTKALAKARCSKPSQNYRSLSMIQCVLASLQRLLLSDVQVQSPCLYRSGRKMATRSRFPYKGPTLQIRDSNSNLRSSEHILGNCSLMYVNCSLFLRHHSDNCSGRPTNPKHS